MEPKISVCIADDHPVFLEGLLSVISRRENIEVIGQAANGIDALALLRSRKPDVALLDVQMPGMDGIRVAELILKENPAAKIVFLTMFNDETLARRATHLGIKGFVLKENAVTQITQAIETVAGGGLYLSEQVSQVVVQREPRRSTSEAEFFTLAEKKILRLIADGKSSRQISQSLNNSLKTIENHRGNICKKLGISGTASLLRYAMQNKSLFE